MDQTTLAKTSNALRMVFLIFTILDNQHMEVLFSLLTCLLLKVGTLLWELNSINFKNLIHLVTLYN